MAIQASEDRVTAQSSPAAGRRFYPWVVFGLTFALLLSDYMSRQVLSAVFPFLKQEWSLSDTQLGGLTSIVALTVGLLAVPLSLLGDRWGRVRAVVAMGILWSLATIGAGLAANYGQLFFARFLIGVGEAAYGSVGLALVLAVFAASKRASLTGAFMAGGSFGSVLGVALGGVLAVQFGWRWAFGAMGALGLILAAMYLGLINERKLAKYKIADVAGEGGKVEEGKRAKLSTLFSTPSVVLAYIGSGLQLFITGALFAWLPSYFNRAYGMKADRAGAVAALFILIIGVGMIGCGMITDRASRTKADRKWTTAIVFSALSLVFVGGAFLLKPGSAQLLLLAFGSFFCAGTAGPAGAMVARLTHESIRATAFGTFTFFNNLLGLAAGPLVTGALADRVGLDRALLYGACISAVSVIALLAGRKLFPASLKRLEGQGK